MLFDVQDGPGEAVVSALAIESETPERVWNQNMATTTALEIANLANAARKVQVFWFLIKFFAPMAVHIPSCIGILDACHSWPAEWLRRITAIINGSYAVLDLVDKQPVKGLQFANQPKVHVKGLQFANQPKVHANKS